MDLLFLQKNSVCKGLRALRWLFKLSILLYFKDKFYVYIV